jgi:hypothetical protein
MTDNEMVTIRQHKWLADQEVINLNLRSKVWTTTIPVRPDNSDQAILRALEDIDLLLAEVIKLQDRLAALGESHS